MIKKSLLVVATIGLLIVACSKDSEDTLDPAPGPNPPASTCDTTGVTYSTTITGLLGKYGCTNCHSGTSPSGGFTLTSYNAVKAKITDGRLFGAINHTAGFKPMPQGGNKMSDCDINKIKAWIDRGSVNN